MAEGQKFDSIFIGSKLGGDNLALPYEDITYRPFTDTTDNDCRLVGSSGASGSSMNCFVNIGGSIQRRPNFAVSGTPDPTFIISGKRIDQIWFYAALPDSSGGTFTYLLMSVFNAATSQWEMYYYPLYTITPPVLFTNYRSINNSIAVHKVGFSKGLAYIKGIPTGGEKLGTIIFDGSGGSQVYHPWGLLGPTVPARLDGWTGHLTTAVTDVGTSWVVAAVTAPPATPFTLQSEYENVTVTVKAGAGPYTLTVTRGINGTTKAPHLALTPVLYRNWAASAHKVDVKQYWLYSYSNKSVTGQFSNRADVEHNPDLLPSYSGPFFDLIPKYTIQGDANTADIPTLAVWRSTDGGNALYALEEVTNTGAGNITYLDDSLGTGASSTTFSDPIPDNKLDTSEPAPSLTSNSPPPSVNPPQVVGTDTPRRSSKIATFSSRFWYAIDNIVYYSGDEEVKTGNPEECWASGVGGNFMRFTDKIVSIEATGAALYFMGTQNTYMLTGTNKETFYIEQISASTPMNENNPDASLSFLDRVAFIAGDGRAIVITGRNVDTISEPLITLTGEVKITFYVAGNNQWLIFLNPVNGTNTSSTMWIYDWRRSMEERRDFWYPPWVGRISALIGFQIFSESFLWGATSDNVGSPVSTSLITANIGATNTSGLRDDTLHNAAWTTEDYSFGARIQPIKNPAGNHMNKYAIPAATTVAAICKIDHNNISGNLGVQLFYDNSGTSSGITETTNQTAPTRRAQSLNYVTKEWHFWTAGQDFAMLITPGTISSSGFLQVDRVVFGMDPSAGPDAAGQTGQS